MSYRRGLGECTEPPHGATTEPVQSNHRARTEPTHRARTEPARDAHASALSEAPLFSRATPPHPPAAQAAFADITALFAHYNTKSSGTGGHTSGTLTESVPEMLQPEMLQQDQFVTLALDTGLAGEESFPLSRILALYARVVLPVSIEAVGKGAAGKVRRKPLP